MTTVSKRAADWAGLAGEVLAILLGVWMISWGWEEFGSSLVLIGIIGFVVSSVRLWRGRRQRLIDGGGAHRPDGALSDRDPPTPIGPAA